MRLQRPCVLIPSYNAASTIGALVTSIKPLGVDVIVVNDGSEDRTAQVAADAGALVIGHVRNRGKGAALRTGFAFTLDAGYDAVVTLDSDGQHDPREIPHLLETARCLESEGIVLGHRLANGAVMPTARRWTNRLMSWIVSTMTRQSIPDSQCGFRVIPARALQHLTLTTNQFELETELLFAAAKHGWRIHSVPIRTIYDHHASHIRPFSDGLRFVRLVMRYLFQLR